VFSEFELEKLRKTRFEVVFKGKIGILEGKKESWRVGKEIFKPSIREQIK
jgi:hypothetical protein